MERLETNASGREVTKVVVTRQGVPEQYSADIVVVSCGAVNSAALLLRSANEKHPRGLGNSSDVVGRHYMRHNCSAFMAISKDPNPTVFQKTLALNDFYFRSDDWEYPLGEIQMLGKSDGEMLKGEAPAGRFGSLSLHSIFSPNTPSTSGCNRKICPIRITVSPSHPMAELCLASRRPISKDTNA